MVASSGGSIGGLADPADPERGKDGGGASAIDSPIAVSDRAPASTAAIPPPAVSSAVADAAGVTRVGHQRQVFRGQARVPGRPAAQGHPQAGESPGQRLIGDHGRAGTVFGRDHGASTTT